MIEFSEFGTKLDSGNTYDIYCELRSNQTGEDGGGMNKYAMPIAFKTETGWGFKDINDNVIVPPIYRDVTDFRDGIAWVKNDKSLWGSVNLDGNVVVPNKFKKMTIIQPEVYEENVCIVGWLPNSPGAEIIDYKSGKKLQDGVIETVWTNENQKFSFFCCADDKDRISVINKKDGTELFKFSKNKTFAGYFAPSYVGIYDGRRKKDEWPKPRYGIFDMNGRTVIECNNQNIKKLSGKYEHIIEVHPKGYSSYNQENFLYDLKLQRQVGSKYTAFYENKWNWDCPLIVTCVWYGYGDEFCGLLDLVTGKQIISPYESPYRRIELPRTQNDPIVARRNMNNNKYYLISFEGKEFCEIESDGNLFFKNGFSHIKQNGKLGFINTKGDVIVEPEYDKANDFEYNDAGILVCKVMKNGKVYYLDTEGNRM